MFLLVLAHPGCPGQNAESHKMVVFVVVGCNAVYKAKWLLSTTYVYWCSNILYMLFCYVHDTLIVIFLQDPWSDINNIAYAGISKSMYAGSVLSVESKFRLMKFDSDGTFRESILAVT